MEDKALIPIAYGINRNETENDRIERDCLYGRIHLPAILSKIINTKEFQRLRRIKQLGGVDYVFKDATYTRYEHSIGTAYLAGVMAEFIRLEYPDACDEHDVLCVQIAALCHDLGHGPYSYVFCSKVLPQLGIDGSDRKNIAYLIFERIWKKVVIEEQDLASKLKTKDMDFIRELICGNSASDQSLAPYNGREKGKWILYQIFSNPHQIVDACKCDYIIRDCLASGILTRKLIKDLLPIENGNRFIAILPSNPDVITFTNGKIEWKTLFDLHRKVYQSPEVNAVEHMISDAIVSTSNVFKISENFHDLEFFCGLDDHILWKIRDLDGNENEKIANAQRILECLDMGKRYKYVGTFKVNESEIGNEITNITEEDPGIPGDKIRISVLRKEAATVFRLRDDERAIQVFCVDPSKTDAVKEACSNLRWDILEQ